jgi:signal transduction histidine kinase/CheY-like chemotaxis protein/HPt (histidine-containing phosphotransfer) domain-containing protein
MGKIGLRYLVFWIFLLGIIVIVFLQVISGNNINRLINSNRRLLNEIEIQNDIRKIESDVLTLESDVRGAVITGDSTHLKGIWQKVRSINAGLHTLRVNYPVERAGQIDSLDMLVRSKINFSQLILNAYTQDGKGAAEQVINTDRGRILRDSIAFVIARLDANRQAELQAIIGSIENTGRRARLWGFIFAGVALLALITAFLYTINKGRQQTRMIQTLNESERRNKEAAIMKEQFMANMSHEIRTPMNSILGFTNLLKRTHLNEEQYEYVQNIHSSGENLLALVNDILDLSKIEAGMMYLEESRFSLRSLVSSVGAMFLEKVREKDLKFETHVNTQIPDILVGDAIRLTQVLVNLLSNAVKFTEKGSIILHAEPLELSETDTRIRITVTDTGIGIAPDKQQKIFERFQQAEAETTRRFGGTGLGLAIVKQLVDLQKGLINVKSNPGKGTEFTVELPFKLPDIEEMFSEAMAAQNDLVPLEKIKVLIAEDHPMNQQLVGRLMQSWSIDYKLVGNGNEAISALKQHDFSLVLMDIQMPDMDGYTATSIIRSELNLDLPIIAMTAHAMAGEKEKCIQLGMNDYVSKPIKETILYNMIARYAQHPGNGRERPLISLEYLHQLSGNDPEFERQMLEQFLVQTPRELDHLQAALQEEDYDQVRRLAHSMKSTVGYIGMSDELHPFLERIEKGGPQNREELMDDFTHIQHQCETAMREVKEVISAKR